MTQISIRKRKRNEKHHPIINTTDNCPYDNCGKEITINVDAISFRIELKRSENEEKFEFQFTNCNCKDPQKSQHKIYDNKDKPYYKCATCNRTQVINQKVPSHLICCACLHSIPRLNCDMDATCT